VSDRRHSWRAKGVDSARSGSGRGQDPARKETGGSLGKDADRYIEHLAGDVRGMNEPSTRIGAPAVVGVGKAAVWCLTLLDCLSQSRASLRTAATSWRGVMAMAPFEA